jgi:HK97 family phage prohead protease
MQIEFRNGDCFISGYVNATEKQSHILANERGKKFREIIQPNTFTKAIRRANEILLLFNHDIEKRLGSSKTNMKLYEDAIGLKAEVSLKEPSFIERVKERGFLQGWSFGFIEKRSHFEVGSDGIEKRFIEDMDLVEISLLGDGMKPAYPSCSVEVRSQGIVERRYSDNFQIDIQNPLDFSLYQKQIDLLKMRGLKI